MGCILKLIIVQNNFFVKSLYSGGARNKLAHYCSQQKLIIISLFSGCIEQLFIPPRNPTFVSLADTLFVFFTLVIRALFVIIPGRSPLRKNREVFRFVFMGTYPLLISSISLLVLIVLNHAFFFLCKTKFLSSGSSFSLIFPFLDISDSQFFSVRSRSLASTHAQVTT